jgi:NhaA family Na+:H+ antiporter
MGVRSWFVYLLLGLVVWLAFLKSGVHATLAAVLMAFTIPARTSIDGSRFSREMESLLGSLRESRLPSRSKLLTPDQHRLLGAMERAIGQATAPLQRLEHELVPLVAFIVMPLFALANAGVVLGAGSLENLRHPISLGIILGLFLGKQVGVLGFSWIAVKTGLGELPAGCNMRHLHAVSVLAGIGFTMSLFIGGLAFPGLASYELVKVGVLAGSAISAVVGGTLLFAATRARDSIRR